MTKPTGRTRAEWVSFGAASFVLLVVVGLIVSQMTGTREPPEPIATRSGPMRETAGRFSVPVEVANRGDITAADVQVTAELTIDGTITRADQVIALLAGGEKESLVFVFDENPDDGEVVIGVGGYAIP